MIIHKVVRYQGQGSCVRHKITIRHTRARLHLDRVGGSAYIRIWFRRSSPHSTMLDYRDSRCIAAAGFHAAFGSSRPGSGVRHEPLMTLV